MLPLLNGRNNSGVKSFECDGITCFTNSCIRSCRKIRLIGTPRYRCPLQSAAVRTGGFFALRNGRNIVPGITAVPKAFSEELRNWFPGRMPSPTYPIARWEQAVFLSDKLAFVRQKRLLCEAGGAFPSHALLLLYTDTDCEKIRNIRLVPGANGGHRQEYK